MFLSKRPRKGINYYLVVKTYRRGETVRQKTILYLGRLDNLTPERRIDLERKIKDVCDEDILQDFRRELYALGYSEELVPLEEFNDLRWWRRSTGTLRRVVESWMWAGFCDNGHKPQLRSMQQKKTTRWYETTTLGQLTGIKSEDFTGRTLLRILRYLREDAAIPISSYFEGGSNLCALIEFGYSRDHRGDRRQVVIGWAVDQEGISTTHYLSPATPPILKPWMWQPIV